MIYLDNLLLWDDLLSPVRVPRIEVKTETLSAAAGDDGWIIAGPYRIRVIVEGGEGGLSVNDPSGNVLATANSGSIFVDQGMFEVQTLSGNAALGSARGCFDIIW